MKSEIKFKLLLLIVRKNESKKLIELLSGYGLSFQMAALAEGTAKTESLSLLGLTGPEKTLLYTLGEESLIRTVLQEVSAAMEFDKVGGGIGLMLPLTGICSKQAFDIILEKEVKNGR